MSIAALSAVWDRSKAKGNDRLVLLAIADSAGGGDDDGEIYITDFDWIAKKSNMTVEEVERSIQRLQKMHELDYCSGVYYVGVYEDRKLEEDPEEDPWLEERP
jgi:hypothetical protein